MVLTVLKEWCKEKHTSIPALEEKCGFGNATIRKWENSQPRIDNLVKVSEATGIPLAELVGKKQDPPDTR